MSGRASSCLALLIFASMVGRASAHPLAPAVLTLEVEGGGLVTMRWRAPVRRPTGQSLRPAIPEGCEIARAPSRSIDEDGRAFTETTSLTCSPVDLVGTVIEVDGFEDSTVNVVVRIVRADGRVDHAILDAATPRHRVASATEERSTFVDYALLGVDHLLTGWDHLTFVLGLLVLFGWRRRLIAAVTAFTLGHSLTLALSVMGFVRVPQALVEALIALTIVVLALEIQSPRRGPVWRHPWTLPAALGLLHGLGFASVLSDAGLPRDEIPLALFGFNVGLELGQLLVIAVAGAGYAAVRRVLPARWRGNRSLAAYAIGSLAAFWVIERTVAAFAG